MKCARCSRPMAQAAGWIGDMPIGPVCLARIARIEQVKLRAVAVVKVDENQIELDLFGEDDDSNH